MKGIRVNKGGLNLKTRLQGRIQGRKRYESMVREVRLQGCKRYESRDGRGRKRLELVFETAPGASFRELRLEQQPKAEAAYSKSSNKYLQLSQDRFL